MNLMEIKKARIPKKDRTRVGRGRGSGLGKTSGKGHKGQSARSGVGRTPLFEGGTMPLYRRLPKRGFNNKRFRDNWLSINLKDLNSFTEGEEVSMETLVKADVIKAPKSKKWFIKLLGKGTLNVNKLKIKVHKISKTAREMIEKANGSVEIIKINKFKRSPRRKSS